MKRTPTSEESFIELRRRGIRIGTILDVGVYLGTPPLKKVYPDIRHLLFEPIVEHNEHIAQAYRDIDHDIINAAVSDADGDTLLRISSVQPGVEITHSRIIDEPTGAPEERLVSSIRLDNFLSMREEVRPYLLKIDVDGAESRVLDGASPNVLKETAVLSVEITVSAFGELVI